jgi:hypothetical protein
MFGLFLLFLLGQSLAGYYDYNTDQHAHQQPSISYPAYLTSSHLWARVFENWESEFLQMAAYVILTVFLFQRGSAESKDPDSAEDVDEAPRSHQHDPQHRDRCVKGDLRSRSMPIPCLQRYACCSCCPSSGTPLAARKRTMMSSANTANLPSLCCSMWAPRDSGSSHSRIGRANF